MKKLAIAAAVSALFSEASATTYDLSYVGYISPLAPYFAGGRPFVELTSYSISPLTPSGPTNSFSIYFGNASNLPEGNFSYSADWTYYGASGFLVANNVSCISLDTSDFCNAGILSLTTEGSFQTVTALDTATQTPLAGPTSEAYDLRWTAATSSGVYDWKFTFSPTAIPVPAAAWLFGTALVGLFGVNRKE